MFKALNITNVGRFKTLAQKADENCFRKNTFIFGNNTFGKSTLTAIFRSLQENNPDYVVGRKTFGTEMQVVKFIPVNKSPIGEYRYKTEEGAWSAEYKDIVIFDSHFVRESVYTQSQEIDQDQQKSIEAFMLGAKGRQFNLKIDELVKKIGENTRLQSYINSEYKRIKHRVGDFEFEAFLMLPNIDDADKKLAKVKKNLDKVNNFELISAKLLNLKKLLEKYRDFDTTPISKKLSVNSDLIAEHFKNHINSEEPKEAYSAFLQAGEKLRKREKGELCPFCTQPISASAAKEFLQTIDSIYNQNYRDLQNALKVAGSLFNEETFSTEVEKNSSDLVSAGHTLENDFSDVAELIKNCARDLVSKKEDLASTLKVSEFEKISQKAGAHILALDKELEDFKNPTDAKENFKKVYANLLATLERHGSWKERSEGYLAAKKSSEELKKQKDQVWSEYLSYAESLSGSMLGEINTILSECKSTFSVEKFAFQGNQRQDLLVLGMSGEEILNNGEDNVPTVKNSLSDSDKWILALAFFLATTKNDPDAKVIVIDDPVSSFDSERKRLVLKQIMRVFKGSDKQLILLTHERGFYKLLFAEKEWESPIFLKISFDAKKGSDLIACDPSNEPYFMEQFNIWIKGMHEAGNSYDLEFVKNAHDNIRPVIEHVMKVKYPLDLDSTDSTLDKMLNKLEQKNMPYASVSPRAEIRKLLPNVLHHDNSKPKQYPAGDLGIDDYKVDIQKAFEVMKML